MEKKMENDMETGIISSSGFGVYLEPSSTLQRAQIPRK